MRRLTHIAAFALAAALLAACSGGGKTSTAVAPLSSGAAGAGQPHDGGTLKIGAPVAAADTMFALFAHTEGSLNDLALVDDPLVNADPDLNVVPWLAERWEVSKDGRTYTFHLHHNAKWSDGQPVTSADVKFEYDLTTNPKTLAPYKADYDEVVSMTTPDKWTAVYTLKAPDPGFLLNVVGDTYHAPIPIHVYGRYAPEQLQHMDLSKNLVTCGPYTLKEWVRDDRTVLQANPLWWGGRPHIDQIYIKDYTSENALQIALQNGDVDMGYLLPTPMYLSLKDDPRYTPIHTASLSFNWFVPNLQNPILADVQVRRAIMYAYDRKTEAEKLFHNEDIPSYSFIPRAVKWAYNASIAETAFPHDPVKAGQLLDADGWAMGTDGYRHKNGQLLAFTTSIIAGNDITQKSFELWQANLKAVGIKTDARQVEFNLFFADEAKGKFDVDIGGFQTSGDPDPYIFLSSKSWSPVGLNYAHFADPDVDALIDQARRETDIAKRKTLYDQLQQLVVEKVPYLWDNAPYYRNVVNTRVHGVDPSHGGTFSLMLYDEPKKWWIAQ